MTLDISKIKSIVDNKNLIYPILIISLTVNVIITFTFFPDIDGDAVGYNNIGLNIASGKGFSEDGKTPTAVREPACPFFIAIVYFIFGYHPHVVKLVQAIIGVAIVFLVFNIGRQVLNQRIALATASLTAIWLPLMRYCGKLITEILFTLAIVASVYCLLKLKNRPRIWMAALCGLILGLGALTRVTLLLIPFFVLFWILIAFPIKKTRTILLWGVLFVSMMVPVSLWIVRCYVTQGQFILLTTHASRNLYTKGYYIERKIQKEKEGVDLEFDWYKRRQKLKFPIAVAIRKYILKHPKEYLLSTFGKFTWFWNPVTRTFIKQDIPYYILYVAILIMYGFALIGMVMTFLPKNINSGSTLISLFIIYITAIHSLTHGIPRYRRPIMPFVILLAFYGIFIVFDYLKRVKSSRLLRATAPSMEEP